MLDLSEWLNGRKKVNHAFFLRKSSGCQHQLPVERSRWQTRGTRFPSRPTPNSKFSGGVATEFYLAPRRNTDRGLQDSKSKRAVPFFWPDGLRFQLLECIRLLQSKTPRSVLYCCQCLFFFCDCQCQMSLFAPKTVQQKKRWRWDCNHWLLSDYIKEWVWCCKATSLKEAKAQSTREVWFIIRKFFSCICAISAR